MTLLTASTLLVLAVVLGIAVPWLVIRMLVPSLEQGRLAENYRGRRVFLGLGIAWLVWSGSSIVMGVAAGTVLGGRSILQILMLAGMLALVAFSLGAVDDAFGSSDARGFKGHLRALSRGRLTTGGLKLFGISLASYIVALFVVEARGRASVLADGSRPLIALALALPVGAAIALTSNLVNLTDLRPGRALKSYTLLALGGAFSAAFGLSRLGDVGMGPRIIDFVALFVFLAGPVVATWRYDVGERGMLGDAGANPAGAVAGLLIVSGLPFWATGVYLVAVLWLNVTSERVSFSAVIEGNALLRRIDAIGRSGSVREHEVAHKTDGAE